MFFKEDFLEEVRNRNNIVDVISSYIKLQRKGNSYMGLCPFHNEKTGSFSVHPGRQMYHCFGCHASGDVFTFVMEYDSLTFQEAVANLALRAGMTLPEGDFSDTDRKEKDRKQRLFEINKDAAAYYYQMLRTKAGAQALSYLQNRGLRAETIRSFGLGYAGKTDGKLYAYLKSKEYSDKELLDSGLFVKKGERVMDKFWNRVMFPIMDVNRRVIGFGGRVMGDGEPKYLNSPETLLFDKSKNLYGLHEARSSPGRKLMLCEGYMDVISLHQAGFTGAVASLGTALTSRQSGLLHRYVDEIYLLYDTDAAGIKASLRAIPMLRETGITARVVDMKPYKDPDELIKAGGAELLNKRLEKAENGFLFEVRMIYEKTDMNDPQGKSNFTHAAAKMLLTFSDEIERNAYLDSVCARYHIDREVMKRQLGKLAMNGVAHKIETEEPVRRQKTDRKTSAKTNAETAILSWISKNTSLFDIANAYLSPEDFSEGINRSLAEELFARLQDGRTDVVAVLNAFYDSTQKGEAAAVMENRELPETEEEQKKAMMEVILTLASANLEIKLESTSDMSELQKLMEEKKRIELIKAETEKGV